MAKLNITAQELRRISPKYLFAVNIIILEYSKPQMRLTKPTFMQKGNCTRLECSNIISMCQTDLTRVF